MPANQSTCGGMTITIGDKSRFAIECGITQAYERLSFRAWGYFVIFIEGQRYGLFSPNATMLACSFGEVEDRIADRGKHTTTFATHPDAGAIADAFRDVIYAPNKEMEFFFGMSHPEMYDLIRSSHLKWAPDGDRAFDDWSFVLQFDVEDRVRLIAFRSIKGGYHHDPRTLKDIWLKADEFYKVLQDWRDAFENAWTNLPKISEADE